MGLETAFRKLGNAPDTVKFLPTIVMKKNASGDEDQDSKTSLKAQFREAFRKAKSGSSVPAFPAASKDSSSTTASRQKRRKLRHLKIPFLKRHKKGQSSGCKRWVVFTGKFKQRAATPEESADLPDAHQSQQDERVSEVPTKDELGCQVLIPGSIIEIGEDVESEEESSFLTAPQPSSTPDRFSTPSPATTTGSQSPTSGQVSHHSPTLKQSPQELQSQPQHEERCSPSQKSPVEEQSFFCEQEKEIELLQEELHNQQKLSGGLRVQLLDQEDQVAELTEAIKTAQVERRNLETEQQESEQEAQGLRQELATSRRQIVEEQTINRALRQQLEVSQKSPQLDNSTLAADLAEARRLAQVHIQNGETLGALLKSESTARHNLEVRLHFLEQRQGQTNPFLRQQANEIVQLRNTVAGYEDQLKNAVALKDRAEGQVEQLKEEVQALVNGVTLQYVNDGVKDEDLETSMVVKPNELHDLRQSFELSQAKCSEVLKANDKLFEQAEDAKKAALALRADNDLQKDKVARYSAAFKTVQEKVNNWTQTLPGIAQMQDSIDEVPGLQELLETSAVHEQDTVKMVKKQVDEISQLKAKVLRRERKFCREVEHLTQRMDKLQEENIRLDESNCNLTAQIEDLQQEKAVIQHDLDQMTRACEIWEQQCNEQAFGDTAELLTAAHKQEAEHASDQVAALTNRIALMNRAYHMMEWDLNSYQGWAAREMEGIRTLGAERDWYRAQTNALRRRFQSELLARPLDIPWRSDFSDMTSEKQRDLIAGEDAIIQTLVGMNLGRVADIERENARRGENGGPSGIETDQVWAPLIAEYLRVTRPKAEPAQGPPPKAGPTSAEKGKQRAEEGDGTSTFFSEGRRGLGIWMLGQVH